MFDVLVAGSFDLAVPERVAEPAALVRCLREIVDDWRAPLFVTGTHVFADLVTHDLDIRRPPRRPRPMPPEADLN